MRNMEKAIEAGKVIVATKRELDLGSDEMGFFKIRFEKDSERSNYDALFNAVYASYRAGLAVGMKIQRADNRKSSFT